MFADRPVSNTDERSVREVYSRPDNEPTKNDAEVQVLEPIGPELILNLAVKNSRDRTAAEKAMELSEHSVPVLIVPSLFA